MTIDFLMYCIDCNVEKWYHNTRNKRHKTKKKEVESKMKNFVDVVAVMLAVCFMVFGAFIVWAVIANSISWGVSVNVPALVAGLLVFAFGAYMF